MRSFHISLVSFVALLKIRICGCFNIPNPEAAVTTAADASMDTMTSSAKAVNRVWGNVQKLKVSTNMTLDIFRLYMDDDGQFPNNPRYPLLLFKAAFQGTQAEGYDVITSGNKWTNPWAWGIFTYHHYHSVAWELLLCVEGEAQVQLGGNSGPTVKIEKGDQILVPPGFAHKQLDASRRFTLLGSYPTDGSNGPVDTLTGSPTEAERQNILQCPVPSHEPIFGLEIATLCGADAE